MQTAQPGTIQRLQKILAYGSIIIGVVIAVFFGWIAITEQFTFENWWNASLGILCVCSALEFLEHHNPDGVNSTSGSDIKH